MCISLCLQTSGNKVEKVYSDNIPVNSASELRKRPPSLCASSRGNVMQKAKVNWLLRPSTVALTLNKKR